MNYRQLAIVALRASYLPAYKAVSTNVENPLQIGPFLQNKPNFRKSQMNVSDYITREYANWTLGEHGINKPKQTQFKPDSPSAIHNTQYAIRNTNPIQTQFMVSKVEPPVVSLPVLPALSSL